MVTISQKFGMTDYAKANPQIYGSAGHNGLDLVMGVSGTPITSPVSGKVESVGELGGFGGTVKVKGSDGKIYQFSHLKQFNVKPGDVIQNGTALGLQGGAKGDPMAGTSTGSHLHLSVYDNGTAIDPMTALKTPTTTGSAQQVDRRKLFATLFKTNEKFRNFALQKIKEKQTTQATGIPDTGPSLPAGNRVEDFFGDVLQKATNDPMANKIYNYFAPKYGDRLAKKMVVLSNGESGWRTDAYAGGGEDSVGLFQINLNAHNDKIAKYTGTNNLNTNREWLRVPENNMKIAEEVSGGLKNLSPWTYANKGIQTYLGIAGNKRADLQNLI